MSGLALFSTQQQHCEEVPGSPSASRRCPVLHFPPPPPYPPDAPFSPPSGAPSPARRRHAPPPPPSMSAHQDYAYAYHECGGEQRRSRHNYITTYGVEENIYEEIADARGAFENPYDFAERCTPRYKGSAARYRALGRALSEEDSCYKEAGSQQYRPLGRAVSEEVRQVQRGHQRVLGQLDLAMEALIMPGSDPETAEQDAEPDDEVSTKRPC